LDPERAFASYRAVWQGPLLARHRDPGEGSKELHPRSPAIKKSHNQAKDPMGGILPLCG